MSITPLSIVRPLTGTRARTRSGGPRATTNTLQREQHEPEFGILVAIVALAAIGILMVYSSSAMKAYLQQDDTFAIVGPQIQWAALGLVAMLVMMRVDYRVLRVLSVPLFLIGIGSLILVFVPSINVVVGGSSRWLKIGPLPAVHPAEFMKLALVIYLAHWFAKHGTAVRELPVGHAAVPGDHGARGHARAARARPRDGHGAGDHRVHDVLSRGRPPVPPGRARRGCGPGRAGGVPQGLPDGPHQRLARPVQPEGR